MFRDPFRTSRFQTIGDPFASFGRFYGERPHLFWENPACFPYDKPRRVSNRKKATRVEERPSAMNIPVCCQARENPSPKELDKKLKGESNQTGPSQPKLSQLKVDNSVNIQSSKDENVSEKNCKGSFRNNNNKDVAEEDGPDEFKQKNIETTEPASDEGTTSELNQTTNDFGSTEEVSSAKPGMQNAEEQKLNAINNQSTIAREVSRRVESFKGSRQDKEFMYLEEHLTRCILALDLINADGIENVKLARKAAVKEILSVINDLESKVKEPN